MDFVPLKDGVRKKLIREGEGDIPKYQDNAKVTFHFKTYLLHQTDVSNPLDDSKSLGRPMELVLGKQFKMSVWEECIKTMKVNEVSQYEVLYNLVDSYPVVSKHFREFADDKVKKHRGHSCGMMAFTEGVGHKDLDSLIRNPSDLLFELEIVKVELPGEYDKELWIMNPEEKLETVPTLKERGNELYKKQQYEDAAARYGEALGLLEQLLLREKPGDEEWVQLEKMKVPLLSNYAQCKLIQKDYYSVIDCTTKILEIDENNVKALYRRGKAYTGTWDLELARKDFEKVAALDSSLQEEIHKLLKKLILMQKEKDDDIKAKLFGKMFNEQNQKA